MARKKATGAHRAKKAKSPTGKPSKPKAGAKNYGGGKRTSEYTAKKKAKKKPMRGSIYDVVRERAGRPKKY